MADEFSIDGARSKVLRRRAAAELAWLTEHLGINAAEAAVLKELASTMNSERGDAQPAAALMAAWQACSWRPGLPNLTRPAATRPMHWLAARWRGRPPATAG